MMSCLIHIQHIQYIYIHINFCMDICLYLYIQWFNSHTPDKQHVFVHPLYIYTHVISGYIYIHTCLCAYIHIFYFICIYIHMHSCFYIHCVFVVISWLKIGCVQSDPPATIFQYGLEWEWCWEYISGQYIGPQGATTGE